MTSYVGYFFFFLLRCHWLSEARKADFLLQYCQFNFAYRCILVHLERYISGVENPKQSSRVHYRKPRRSEELNVKTHSRLVFLLVGKMQKEKSGVGLREMEGKREEKKSN